MINLREASLTRCWLASFSGGEHEFSESASGPLCSRMVTQHLSLLNQMVLYAHSIFVLSDCYMKLCDAYIFTHETHQVTSSSKGWFPENTSRTTHSEEMVCDKESSAAKGFYSPSKLVLCLNIAYVGKSQWYFECVYIIF